ncbi:zf-HC2 domain-containing protein [Micromonospora sp. STR1_7]|uniref:Zf-HC2 domain-containing protein n=1 Tax=Micromonospora parastrephiae TaxID=2806101 RepID=A0ABS1XST7_9ACTN|nr:zf-HC2 domain-containing protein [Micromonospora parastrephiae]MBM0232310.1 zf-HC2 domain-containing protein [Micromonospora parastrephiae]
MKSDSSMPANDHTDIGGYLMGELDDEQIRQVEEHLAGCADCRTEVESLQEWTTALRAVPDAMLLDGPPEGGDLLLQRTLRQVRSESSGRRQRRGVALSAAAAVVLAAAVSGGVVLGRTTSEAPDVEAQPGPSASVSSADPATRYASASDPGTGARLTVAMTPAEGWVRINAAVSGIPQGARCHLLVVGKDGSTVLTGSWLVSSKGAADGTTLDGSALIDPAQVDSVRVETTDGKPYASVKL